MIANLSDLGNGFLIAQEMGYTPNCNTFNFSAKSYPPLRLVDGASDNAEDLHLSIFIAQAWEKLTAKDKQ